MHSENDYLVAIGLVLVGPVSAFIVMFIDGLIRQSRDRYPWWVHPAIRARLDG